MTKRLKFLCVLLLIPLLAFTAVSVQGAAPGASGGSTPPKCPKRNAAKGTIKYSQAAAFPDSLNPYQTTSLVSFAVIYDMLEGFYRYDGKARYYPLLLSRVPTLKNGGITNGGKTIKLTIKKGRFWSNGAEITSKDIKFGWDVDSDKATGPACSGSCDIISRIDTPDKYTAVLHLKKVYAPVLQYGLPSIWPTKWAGAWNNDPHVAAEKLGQDQTFNFEGPNFPTNGPYQVADFVNNDRIVLHPMKRYNNMTCGGYIQNLIFSFYSEKAGLIAAAASKQVDMSSGYTSADIPELGKHTSAYKLHVDPGFIIEHMEVNSDPTYNGKPNPMGNQKVRQALALALDKYGLVQSSQGLSRKQAADIIAWTFLVNTPKLVQPFADKKIIGQWDPLQKKYDPNTGRGKALADAKKLLAQTPYKSGFSIDFFTSTGNPVRAAEAAVAQAGWSKLGVTTNITFIPASKLFADWDHGGVLAHGTYQISLFAFIGAPDPDNFKYNMQSKYIDRDKTVHATVNANDAGIRNKVIDKAYDTAAHSLNNKIRAANYAAVQVQMNQNAYWIPLLFRPSIVTEDGRILNFTNNPTSFGPEWNVYAWRVKGS